MRFGLRKNRVLPEPEPPMTSTFLFLAFRGSLGRFDIIRLSVCVRMTLFSKTGSTNGAMSSGLPHEAFCQVLFGVIDAQSRRKRESAKRKGSALCVFSLRVRAAASS